MELELKGVSILTSNLKFTCLLKQQRDSLSVHFTIYMLVK